jgi:hypothetical protein
MVEWGGVCEWVVDEGIIAEAALCDRVVTETIGVL